MHKNLKYVDSDPATKETFYVCEDCGALVDQDGNTVQQPTNEIPF
jgi:hypothetical protein